MTLKLAFKVCIVGEPGVGKTSLILRYIENKFKENYIPTLGVDFLTKKLEVGKDKISTNLIIWDIGGQDKWKKNLSLYLQGSDGIIIVYDITRKPTFDNIDVWIENIKQWAGNVPYILVGNKKDLEEHRNITLDEAIAYSKEKESVDVLETSAKTGEVVDEMFYKLAEAIIIEKAKGKHKS